MAITPKQARKNKGAVKEEIKKLEQMIDDTLPRLWADANNYDRQYGVNIDLRSTPTEAAVEGIKQLYRNAGWVVNYETGSQMDPGDWFNFKEARPKK
jgi:hypothetical protein